MSFFQDVSDPEYAQVQEALKNKLKVSANSNPRPTIYAVAVVEEPSASDKKPKQHARITSKGSLRLAHSAEDVSTLERISRRGKLKTHSIMGCYTGQLCGGAVASWLMRSSPGSSLGSSLARGHRVVLWAKLSYSASLHRSIELLSGELNSGGVTLRWTSNLSWGVGVT